MSGNVERCCKMQNFELAHAELRALELLRPDYGFQVHRVELWVSSSESLKSHWNMLGKEHVNLRLVLQLTPHLPCDRFSRQF